MKVREAWAITIVGVALYLVAAYLISPKTLPLAPIPLAVFVAYPYGKRFTNWCHLGVGLGMSMAPAGAWFAAKLSFQDLAPALLLAGFTILWGGGFDIIYATLDIESDRKNRIHSLPAAWGESKARAASQLLHAGAFSCLIGVCAAADLSAWTIIPLGLIAATLFWEHFTKDVDFAFFKLNTVIGLLVLCAIWAGVATR
jgi:4-hydroxybenzoate polyprenyltransferase